MHLVDGSDESLDHANEELDILLLKYSPLHFCRPFSVVADVYCTAPLAEFLPFYVVWLSATVVVPL